ncbi:MAG TPA: VCBS repeat-containing protein, partial [Opitutus sp.]|nr:VCBS repeat-containing protein [Opitutus sp.]
MLLATLTLGGAVLAAPPSNPEFCLPGAVPKPAASASLPLSNQRMAARIREVFLSWPVLDNPYRTPEHAAILRQALAKETDPQQRLALRLASAQALLRAGNSEEALTEFEVYERELHAITPKVPSRVWTELQTSKALCHLRIGEQENCVHHHSSESCLLPIRGGGIHKLQRGSRGAIAELTTLLTRYPGDLRARWLLNIAYMTLGEYPAEVPAQWLIDPAAFESDYDIKRFPDVAGLLGLDVNDLAGGVVMDDFDNDGFLDLMVSAWHPESPLRLFRNNGDGTFADHSDSAGIRGLTGSLNTIHADYNNDGFVDVLLLRGGWLGAVGRYPNSLLRNNGDFTFTDVTEEAGLLSFYPTQTAAWFDYNSDGHLDLFVGNESDDKNHHPCELFHN